MHFVYVHLALYGAWIAASLGVAPGLPKFDPSFVVLAMVASVEAIFLSTFVLISQNRMTAAADKRADLDLHVSLLTDRELTKLVGLVTAIAEHAGVQSNANLKSSRSRRTWPRKRCSTRSRPSKPPDSRSPVTLAPSTRLDAFHHPDHIDQEAHHSAKRCRSSARASMRSLSPISTTRRSSTAFD
jgi:hypothetical protein